MVEWVRIGDDEEERKRDGVECGTVRQRLFREHDLSERDKHIIVLCTDVVIHRDRVIELAAFLSRDRSLLMLYLPIEAETDNL
jgi:hypothetical protein